MHAIDVALCTVDQAASCRGAELEAAPQMAVAAAENGVRSLTHKAASLFLLRFPAGATLNSEQVATVTGTAAAGGIAAR
jgi:hypothetical protein